MAPNGRGGKASKNDPSESRRKEPFQAVLLTSTFDSAFRPATLSPSTPGCLFPLLNVPALHHALDFLSAAGVEELIVFCVDGREAVEASLERHAAAAGKTDMKTTVVSEPGCLTEGDALRELDRGGRVRSDPFLLLRSGSVVANADLSGAVRAHAARKAKDASCVATTVLMRNGPRPSADALAVGTDDEGRVWLYDDDPRGEGPSVPCSHLAARARTTVRTDLADVGIDVCSPEVLARFSDEFDYASFRRDFLRNSAAEEEEGLQNKIYAHVLDPSEYAGRVYDWRSYHAVSTDLLRRRCYPLVPDNLVPLRYVAGRRSVYRLPSKDDGGSVDRSATLGSETLVGKGCVVGAGCRLNRTVLGHGVTVGDRCRVSESHLWDGVVLREGCAVDRSVLCYGCVVKKGAVVKRGCVVGPGCVVGENVVLPEYTRITLEQESEWGDDAGWDDDDEEEEEEDTEDEASSKDSNSGSVAPDGPAPPSSAVKSDHDVVGKDGLGRVWTPSVEDCGSDLDSDVDEDDDDGRRVSELLFEKMRSQSVGFDPRSPTRARLAALRAAPVLDDFSPSASDDGSAAGPSPSAPSAAPRPPPNLPFPPDGDAPSAAAPAPDDGPAWIQGRQRGVDVHADLLSMCLERDRGSSVDNLAIELNGYKFGQNASFADVVRAVAHAVMERTLRDAPADDGASVVAPASLLTRFRGELEGEGWTPLLRKLCRTGTEERAVLRSLEEAAAAADDEGRALCAFGKALRVAPAFRLVLQTLFDLEVLSEEAILGWRRDRWESKAGLTEGGRDDVAILLIEQKATQDFLAWLEEDDEDSSSGSESESESE